MHLDCSSCKLYAINTVFHKTVVDSLTVRSLYDLDGQTYCSLQLFRMTVARFRYAAKQSQRT